MGRESSLSCWQCGDSNLTVAVACTSCGNPLRVVKDRSLAILLAVVLSFVSWTYTYARNWPKFWIGLVLTATGLLLSLKVTAGIVLVVVTWLWAIIDNASKPADFYLRYPEPWSAVLALPRRQTDAYGRRLRR